VRLADRKKQISREEIRAIYQQGEDAVIALVEGLLEKIGQLEGRIEALENQCKKDSRNSSKPPSSDRFGKRTQSLRPKSERKSGGQKDHPGSTLEWSEEVDEVVVHQVLQCEDCGASLANTAVSAWNLRQVHDLPPLQLVVSEYQTEEKYCPCCGMLNRAAFALGVNSVVQYGSGIKGLMVYLMEGQLLPTQRVCELLAEVLGCEVSEGTLYTVR
jgi:transposase